MSHLKLELMFMKHYAPNRCLYIKVAKLRTGVGSAEMSHVQIAVSKYIFKESTGGGGGRVGGVRMDVNEELKFCENKKIKKNLFFFGGGGGVGSWGGVGLGGQGRCEQRSEVFVKKKKCGGFRSGGGGRVGGIGGGGSRWM